MLTLEFVFTAELQLAPWRSYGGDGPGSRRLVAINGGNIRGPRINGTILPVGADWPTLHPGGVLTFDARWSFQTTDGALVYVQNRGIRRASLEVHDRLDRNEAVDPKLVYFRTTPVFETGALGYQWLVHSIFVATGRRGPNALDLDVYEVQ